MVSLFGILFLVRFEERNGVLSLVCNILGNTSIVLPSRVGEKG